MAVVYLARDVRHSRLVALKVLAPELAQALGADRFLREIEIAAALSHPHVVPLLDSGEAEGLLFYAMPFVDGESLRQRLDRERQLPVEDALEITRQAASALSYAHGRGVVHRGGDRLVAARLDTTAGIRVTERRVVLTPFSPPLYDDYDIHPDGRTIALVRPREDAGGEVVLVLDWLAGIRPSAGR